MTGPDSGSAAAAEQSEGGDPVCWLERVCDECGALADGRPAARCARCGADTRAEPER